MAACTSDKTLEEVRDITQGTDPMLFTCVGMDEESQTRASSDPTPLKSDFMVSGYKAYGLSGRQQMVMENYKVEYFTSGTAWDNTERPYWDYTTVPGQYEKYWDFANFPYRFHAIAPCPASTSGFVLTDNHLVIPATYQMQSCHNGMIEPKNAEPYLLAQVHRDTEGKDKDLIADKAINEGSPSKNRYVWMPFHHLNSKIRFGVYTRDNWATANKLYIEGMTIKATSNNFVTQASSYEATGDGSWKIDSGTSGFTGLTQATTAATLLQFDGGPNIEGNDLRDCQNHKSAFMLQCPDGIIQIPQEKVNMTVSFRLMQEGGSLYKEFTDIPIKLEDSNAIDFDWTAGYIYTYYLILGPFDKLEITFTATLTPWEDVTGSLSTDLEQ